MAHYPITHDEEPIRLFKSNFLEFFTHITPIAVLIIWVPVVAYFLISSIVFHEPGTSWANIPLGFVIGLFVWTLTEYVLHRFLFHFQAKSETAKRIFFLFHGVHHAQPQCKTRLVMPPVVSVPMAVVFYGLFYLVLGIILRLPQWIYPSFAGAITGYLCYDMIHYATHHLPMRKGIWKFLKRYHMQHHYKTPNARYGVSSPFWDIIFNTRPE